MDQPTSVQPDQLGGKPHDAPTTAAAAAAGGQPQQTSGVPPASKVEEPPQKEQKDEDEEDSDFDELDEVLDDFSKPQQQKQPENAPPTQPQPAATAAPPIANSEDFDEQAFMKQLERDMANMMGDAQNESGTSDDKDFQNTVEQGADVFTKQLEESGVPPGDFLKQLLAEVMAEEGDGKDKDAPSTSTKTDAANAANAAAAAAAAAEGTPESFNDAIQRTMNRMQESGEKATAAASENDDVPDEMLMQLLKALESSGGGNDDDIQKMFMGFMEKMSSKDILYEPMKELEGKFEPWIAEKQAKGELSDEDITRYQTQTRIVKEVVAKFEEKGYSDDDSQCREWVWERMQEMQNAGNPPDELIPNPLTDMKGMQEAAMPSECAQQ